MVMSLEVLVTLKNVSEGCIFYDIDSNRLPPARSIKIESISFFIISYYFQVFS